VLHVVTLGTNSSKVQKQSINKKQKKERSKEKENNSKKRHVKNWKRKNF
jgi:hypothetical protein